MKGKVCLLIIAISLALLVPTADAGSGHRQSATAVITSITLDPLSVIYEEDAVGDLNRRTFLERMAGTYASFDSRAAPGLKRQMAVFAWIAGRWRGISPALRRTSGC